MANLCIWKGIPSDDPELLKIYIATKKCIETHTTVYVESEVPQISIVNAEKFNCSTNNQVFGCADLCAGTIYLADPMKYTSVAGHEFVHYMTQSSDEQSTAMAYCQLSWL